MIKFRLLNKEIPVFDLCTKEAVRFLQDEDLDEGLYEDLLHNNVADIFIDKDMKLQYNTKESIHRRIIKPGSSCKKRFAGSFSPSEKDLEAFEDLEHIAAMYAVGICKHSEGKLYTTALSHEKWESVSEKEDCDTSVEIRVGEGVFSYYFKRIWPEDTTSGIVERI